MDVHKAEPSIAGLWDLLQQAIQADDSLRIIDRCNDLLRVGGQEPHVLGLLGQSQLKMGFSEQAASNLQIASDALPERSELKTLLLQARVDIQDWQGVLEIFKSLESAMLEAMTGLKVMVNAGVALRRTGRLEQSVAQFRRCIDLIAQARLMKGSKEQKRKVIDLALIAATGGNDKVNLKNMMSRLFPILSESSLDVRIAPVVSMQEWCRGHGIPIKIVDPATEILASNSHRGGVIAAYLTDETWCVTLPHAEIVGGWDFVLSPDGFVLDGASYLPLENFFSFMPHFYHRGLDLAAHVWSDSCIELDVDALFVSTPEKHHFGHWISDFIPRLRAWKQDGCPGQKVAIVNGLPQKHRDMMARFGVGPNDIVTCELGQRYRFRSLRVMRTGSDRKPNPDNVRFIGSALRAAGPVRRREERNLRFWLVRDAGTRVPANQAAVDAVLAEFGVEKINPTKLTMAEQETLFSQAELLIGAFGTELFCLYHLAQGCDLVELTYDEKESTVYGPMCSFLGIHHHVLVCAPAEKSETSGRKFDRDFVVDCDALRHKIRMIIDRV
jgi:hypothetical protein